MGWVFALLSTVARAGSPALDACCTAAASTDCPETVFALGENSVQISGPTGTSVSGAWALSCAAGPGWDAAFRGTSSQTATTGTVLGALSTQAAACWDAACRLPQDTCLDASGSAVRLARCDGRALASDAAFVAPLREPRRAVVVGHRVLGGPEGAAQQDGAPPTLRPPDPTVPSAPTLPCRPATSLRLAANEQVDAGNEAVVAGDLATALDRYRAALTMDRCSALAWAALGDALLSTSHPREALTALGFATQLMPTHTHAWTRLGEASEKAGDRQAAAFAYRRALDQNPGYGPAAQGLGRVQ